MRNHSPHVAFVAGNWELGRVRRAPVRRTPPRLDAASFPDRPLPRAIFDASMTPSAWWTTFFDMSYAGASLRPIDDAQRAALATVAARVAELLQVGPGSLVLDQCCGLGRMSCALGRLGVRTIGVDYQQSYVDWATTAARSEGLPCTFVRGDAHEFVAPEPCDAGVNWFTSFGYSADDDVNLRMLSRMFESLRPGGRFVLETMSVPRLFATYAPARFHRPADVERPGLIILDEPRPDFRRGVIDSTWTFLWPDGRREERAVSTRMFMPHELVRLCERAGFRVIDLLGDVSGTPYSRESARLVVLSEKV